MNEKLNGEGTLLTQAETIAIMTLQAKTAFDQAVTHIMSQVPDDLRGSVHLRVITLAFAEYLTGHAIIGTRSEASQRQFPTWAKNFAGVIGQFIKVQIEGSLNNALITLRAKQEPTPHPKVIEAFPEWVGTALTELLIQAVQKAQGTITIHKTIPS